MLAMEKQRSSSQTEQWWVICLFLLYIFPLSCFVCFYPYTPDRFLERVLPWFISGMMNWRIFKFRPNFHFHFFFFFFCIFLLMPSLHLLRSSYDGLVYDFPCDFWGIVGGYGLQCLRLHYLRSSCDFMYWAS